MAIEGKTKPLEIAMKILKTETIQIIRENPEFGKAAYSILDRWALNQPELLQKLESQGMTPLNMTVYSQMIDERNTLDSETANDMRISGMTQFEILEVLGVEMKLILS